MSELTFSESVAIITGAGRGLGRSHATLLAQRGAKVVVNDFGVTVDGASPDPAPANETVALIRSQGGEAVASVADVSTEAGAQSIVDLALRTFGRIDIVVNNAGIVHKVDFPETTQDDFQNHLNVHLIGSFNVTRAAWPHLATRNNGRVVLTSSPGIFGRGDIVSYASAKAGLIGLARSLAAAGLPLGIKVNVILPGAFTRMTAERPESLEARTERALTLAPEKVSAVVLLLTHDLCPCTGEMLFCAGDVVARIYLAQTRGLVKAEITPEDVLRSWATIIDDTNPFVTPMPWPGTQAWPPPASGSQPA